MGIGGIGDVMGYSMGGLFRERWKLGVEEFIDGKKIYCKVQVFFRIKPRSPVQPRNDFLSH